MRVEEFHVYEVEDDLKLAAARKFLDDRKAKVESRLQWAKRQGGVGVLESRGCATALLCNPGEKPSCGWKLATNERLKWSGFDSYIPDRRKSIGKNLAKQMQSHSIPGASSLAVEVGAPAVNAIVGMNLLSTQAFEEADKVIVIVPKNGAVEHRPIKGLRPLKLSEFYALREKAQVSP